MKFHSNFGFGRLQVTRLGFPFFVAEIGLNHNANEEIGKRTIEAAAKSGANAVKFQTYKTDEFIHPTHPEVKVLRDIFRQYELSQELHRKFQKTANDLGLEFFSTPLCESAVDLLEEIGVAGYKIASGDIVNRMLLKKVASRKKPIFLSTGAADFFEVARALEFLESEGAEQLALFHCVSLYPTPADKLQLDTISYFLDLFPGPVGFSDHSPGFLASAISVGLGASVIEKHFTLDKGLDGPDHSISLSPEEFREMTRNSKQAYLMRGEKQKVASKEEIQGRYFGRRSLFANQDGKPIALRPLETLRNPRILDSWQTDRAQSGSPGDPLE